MRLGRGNSWWCGLAQEGLFLVGSSQTSHLYFLRVNSIPQILFGEVQFQFGLSLAQFSPSLFHLFKLIILKECRVPVPSYQLMPTYRNHIGIFSSDEERKN